MTKKIKIIIFVIIVALLILLGMFLFAHPSSAAQACKNTKAPWNAAVQASGTLFSCMSATDCMNNHYTMMLPSKASCPKASQRCCREPDCDSITSPDPNYPYQCIGDSNPAKQHMVCDKKYRCPGGAENTCCHDVTPAAPQNAPMPALPPPITPPAPAPAPTVRLSSCCSTIVPADTSINGLAQVIVNIYNCIICVIGALTLLFVVIGGVVLILSGGNSERISLGRKIIVGAIVGMVIVLASVLIVNFAIHALGGTMTI